MLIYLAYENEKNISTACEKKNEDARLSREVKHESGQAYP